MSTHIISVSNAVSLTRRRALRSMLFGGVAAGAAFMTSGCGLFTQNADGSYGLSAAVIAFVQNAVNTVAGYIPAIESIAATAASLFGSGYSAIVALGSAALNQVIAYLQNLVANPPIVGARYGARAYRMAGAAVSSGTLVGYTRNGVPVFAQ